MAFGIMMIDLIYCAGGNKRFAQIAIEYGFLYGSRSDDRPYFPVDFVDINYKQGRVAWPNHLAFVREHQPKYAVAPDLMAIEDLRDVLTEAERLAAWAQNVIIVPKVHGIMVSIPSEFAIGYSVPTSYGGTELWIGEFVGRRVHLLGGSPRKQATIWRYLSKDVMSVDGNIAQKLACQRCQFFDPSCVVASTTKVTSKQWPTIQEADGRKWPNGDAPYEAFRRSCRNLKQFWIQLLN